MTELDLALLEIRCGWISGYERLSRLIARAQRDNAANGRTRRSGTYPASAGAARASAKASRRRQKTFSNFFAESP